MLKKFVLALPAHDVAVVIANGPSLRGVDLTSLEPWPTIGMNVAYRDWRRLGWFPTHYACLDEVVGLHHAEAIAEMLSRPRDRRPGSFLLRRNLIERLNGIQGAQDIANFDDLAAVSRAFSRKPITTGSHALIWAITLGYKTILLLGADCNYVEIVPGAEKVDDHKLRIVQPDFNPNYYFDDYQQPGDVYHVPNIGGETHLRSWRMAASVAAEAGVQVYNLSSTSRIDAFDFATLEGVLSGSLIITPREARLASVLSKTSANMEPE